MSWERARHAVKRRLFPLLPSRIQDELDVRYYERRLLAGNLVLEPEISVLDRFVHPGEAVADIGANLGAYTLELSRLVGSEGSVLSFEPVPRNFGLLERLLDRLAPHDNIISIEAAVGETSGRGTLHLPLEGRLPNFYTASLLPMPRVKTRLMEVEVATIDDYRERMGRRFSFIKSDAEGAELMVLRGAQRVIAEDRPALLLEIASRDPAVESFLVERDYRLHQVVDGDLRPSSTIQPVSPSSNFFALTSEGP